MPNTLGLGRVCAIIPAVTLMIGLTAAARAEAQEPSRFITLGTQAGGVPFPDRSQPANLLQAAGQTILIDAGGGTVQQLAKAGVPLVQIDAVVISHLHFDHTGGLFALLGLRHQVPGPKPLVIYGPRGTDQLVDGLLAAMQPGADFMNALRPESVSRDPRDAVKFVEIGDGSEERIGDIVMRVVENTHYTFPETAPKEVQYPSLSMRFDTPDRSIVYTGDTGPSDAVEGLAKGADLLVSEIIDVEATIESIRTVRPDLPEAAMTALAEHFHRDHLTPEEVGLLAKGAGVSNVVLTHLALGPTPEDQARSASEVQATFGGPVSLAADMDEF